MTAERLALRRTKPLERGRGRRHSPSQSAQAMQQPPPSAAGQQLRQIKLSSSRSAFHYVDACISAFQSGETELEISGLGSGIVRLCFMPLNLLLHSVSVRMSRLINLTCVISDDLRRGCRRHASQPAAGRSYPYASRLAVASLTDARPGVTTGTASVGAQQALKAKLTVQLRRSANFNEALAQRKARLAEKKSPR